VRVPGSAHSARVHPPPARCTRTLPAPSLLQKVDFLRNGFVNLAVNVFSLTNSGVFGGVSVNGARISKLNF
jgi:hypothetical protein